MADLICPDCGAVMVLRETTKYRYGDGRNRRFFGCSRYPTCTATHGAHPDGTPMGFPSGIRTKRARMTAHRAFDRLWREGRMSRREAYRHLQQIMGLRASEAHIGRFDIAQCRRLVAMLEGDPGEVADAG